MLEHIAAMKEEKNKWKYLSYIVIRQRIRLQEMYATHSSKELPVLTESLEHAYDKSTYFLFRTGFARKLKYFWLNLGLYFLKNRKLNVIL